eukprot:TRINITY_DN2380_c0_g1_i1.p1 TRINITY_DN2380_c0_g1~~TRINITY_DN2380_c0_g1_i1.p1  ORF type:complete len:1608 (+),score=577.22 TRINITY_DN2380_c0_g1_i1:208-5031(+)
MARCTLVFVLLALVLCTGLVHGSTEQTVRVQKGAKSTSNGAHVQVALATHSKDDGDDDHDEHDGEETGEDTDGETETDEHNEEDEEEGEALEQDHHEEEETNGEHDNETDAPGEDSVNDDEEDHEQEDADEDTKRDMEPEEEDAKPRNSEETDHPENATVEDEEDENDDAETADDKEDAERAKQVVADNESEKEQKETRKFAKYTPRNRGKADNDEAEEDDHDNRLDREPRVAQEEEGKAEEELKPEPEQVDNISDAGEGGTAEDNGSEDKTTEEEESSDEAASSNDSGSQDDAPAKKPEFKAAAVGKVSAPPKANVTHISDYCRVCRALVLGALAKPDAQPGKPVQPCAYASPEMMPACAKWREQNNPLIGPAVDGNKLCLGMKFCSQKELDQIKKNDAELARLRGQKMMSESGHARFDYNDNKFAPLFTGTGVRRVFQRVAFTTPFDHDPFVHVGLSDSDIDNSADARFKILAKNVDKYGFDIEIWTWKDTKIRLLGVTWFAYSRSLALNGMVRSGRIKTRTPKHSFNKRVWFPAEFKSGYPVVSVSMIGMDASTGRPISVNVQAADVDRHGFLAQVKIDPLSIVHWTSFAWIAAVPSNVTGVYSGHLELDSQTTPGMSRFWNPPLGPRSFERRVDFDSEEFDRCEQLQPEKQGPAIVHALIEQADQIVHPHNVLSSAADLLISTTDRAQVHVDVGEPIPAGYPLPKGLLTLGPFSGCPGKMAKVGETLLTIATGQTACSDIGGGQTHPSGCLYSLCDAGQEVNLQKDSLMIGSFGSCPAPLKFKHGVTTYTDGDSTCDKMMGKKAGKMAKGVKCENPLCVMPLNDKVPRQAFGFSSIVTGCPAEFKPMGEILLGVKSITECQKLGGGHMGPDNVAKEREACKLMVCQDSRPGATRLGPETVAQGFAYKVLVPVAKPTDKVAFLIHDQVGCAGASKHAIEVDKNKMVTIPPNMGYEKWKICIGPANALKDDQYVSRDDLQLTVVRRMVTGVKSFLTPMPVDITTKVQVSGGGVAIDDMVAFINANLIGCPKAAANALPLDEKYDVALRLPMGTYKVCYAKKGKAAKDSDFVDQGGIYLNVGHNGVKNLGPWVPLREVDLNAAVLNDRPVGYWKMAEQKGEAVAKDSGNFNRHAFLSGTVIFGSAQITKMHTCGAFGKGHLTVTGKGVNAIPALTETLSLEAWIHPRQYSTTGETVIAERWELGEDGEAWGYRLFTQGNKAVFQVQKGKSSAKVVSDKLRSKRANHVVGVLSKETISIYVNGKISASAKHNRVQAGKPEVPFRIGGVPGLPLLNFVGAISDVALYKQPLTAERIAIHYAFGRTMNMRVNDACIPVRVPTYKVAPQVSVEVTGFDVVELKAIRLQAQATKVDSKGFTLRLHTWDDSRFKKISVDFRASNRAVPRSVDPEDEHVTDLEAVNSKSNPAKSCLELYEHDKELANDVYWIRLKSGKIVNAMCDMEAGGWTRVMNIISDSYAHANEIEELNPYEVHNPNKAAKYSDKDINAISTSDYFEFRCGSYSGYLKNRRRKWTSMLKNNEDWETAPDMGEKFYCSANLPGYGFGDQDPDGDQRCHDGFIRYAARTPKEGLGCFHDGQGWGQNGALWVK